MFKAIGCDPEVFLKDKFGNVVSAIDKIGGSKRKPKVLKELNVKHNMSIFAGAFALQEDNVTLEYNTPAANKLGQWRVFHRDINNYIDNMLDTMGLERYIVPSVVMPDSELANPKAWVFGCDPDYDAWKMKMNPRPESNEKNLRSAGGHIHVSYENPNKVTSIELVRLLDAFVGIPLMVKEEPNCRAELYGKAGAMRFKPFGIEYRTPSNYWTSSSNRVEWVYEQVKLAVANVFRAKEFLENEIPEILNTKNKELGKQFMSAKGIIPCP